MISPEVLRRFPVFVGFNDAQLKALAMIADERELEANKLIFEEGASAKKLYLLVNGSIDLYMKSEEEYDPTSRRDFSVGEINPGELFGISSLLDPPKYSVAAISAQASTLIEFDANALRALAQEDNYFAYNMMHQIMKSLIQRLKSTRVQLAAAWAT